MKIKTILLGLSICSLFVAGIASAQQGTGIRKEVRDVRANASSTRNEIKKEARDDIRNIRASSSVERQKLQVEAGRRAEDLRNEIQKKREENKIENEKNRQDFKKAIAVKKEENKKLISEKRSELSEKLKVIKSDKKQQITLKISDQFQQINSKVLSNLTNILSKQELILQKISSRSDMLTFQNEDAGLIKEAIAKANTALTEARSAIVTQTAKVYTISVRTEDKLKSDVGATRQLLQKDLDNVRSLVKGVHTYIKEAVTIFEKTPGADKIIVTTNVSTSTASTTTNN